MSSVSLLSETSVLLTGGGKSSKLSLVVLLVTDPVDSGILSDGGVVWINAEQMTSSYRRTCRRHLVLPSRS